MGAAEGSWSRLSFVVALVALGAGAYAVLKSSPDGSRGGSQTDGGGASAADVRDLRTRIEALEARDHAPNLAAPVPSAPPTRKEVSELVKRVVELEKQTGIAADDPEAPPPKMTPLEEAAERERLAEEARRMADMAQAKIDAYQRPPRRPIGSPRADAAKIDLYLSWTQPEQFVDPSRAVTANMLVDWMADSDVPKDVREKARDALVNSTARSLNPDLSSGTRGSRRAAFSLTRLVPQLMADDPAARRYADKVLCDFWYPSDKDIARYNLEDPATWIRAIDAWVNMLGTK